MTPAGLLRRAALLALATAVACARPYPPPGGETPREEPAVLETVPQELAVDAAFRGPALFRFDRRISEQLEANPVVVSPQTSAVRVARGRSELRVTLDAGWEPGRIYRVIVLPGVRDLFGNRTTAPIELVFSTGPEIPETAVAGIITERITGRAARDGMVEATRVADSVRYVAAADTAGFFALRHLPRGEYDVIAYADQNRNRRPDAHEPVSARVSVELRAANDTVPLLLSVLPPDTTPAALASAQAPDSQSVRLQFDDYLDPDAPLDEVSVRLIALPDSSPGPSGNVVTAAEADERRRAAARQDTVPADTAATRPQPARDLLPDASPLPAREVVFLTDSPLRPGGQYIVVVSGVTNIHGLAGGGGEATFTAPERPDPPAPAPGGDMAPGTATPDTWRATGLTLPLPYGYRFSAGNTPGSRGYFKRGSE